MCTSCKWRAMFLVSCLHTCAPAQQARYSHTALRQELLAMWVQQPSHTSNSLQSQVLHHLVQPLESQLSTRTSFQQMMLT
jgi:hypothetical protein